MDGYQGLTALIESAWEELYGSDAGRRDLCLDVVSDVLETYQAVEPTAPATMYPFSGIRRLIA